MGDPELKEAEPEVEAPALPAVREERQGEFQSWPRWKGSLSDITKIFRLAQDLVEQATDGLEQDPYSAPTYTLGLRGKERNFSKLEDLEAELSDIELEAVQRLSMRSWTEKVAVSIEIGRLAGSYLSVSGEDPFAVAGVESELKGAMDRGRRWSQVGEWPHVVAFWAPWVGILGLSLLTLSGNSTVDTLGEISVLAAGFMFVVVLFMRYVEPRLVPPLELLSESEPQTVAQLWKGRLLKVIGFAAAGIAGAAINGLTGFLF